MRTASLLTVLLLVSMGLQTRTISAQDQPCTATDQSRATDIPGVTLTWDSSFHCVDSPASGTYTITMTVTNQSSSVESVRIESTLLSHTTPRPRGTAPAATASTSGLPLTLDPGQSANVTINGNYTLVATDEGAKANLHLRASGHGSQSGEPFRLGINVQLRGPAAHAPAASVERRGPPAWASAPDERADRSPKQRRKPSNHTGGPPPWAGPAGRGR